MRVFIVFSRKIITIGTIAVIVIAIIVTSFWAVEYTKPENIKKREIKEKIAQKVGDSNFTVDEIMVESQDWYLAKITVDAKIKEYSSSSLAILHKENGQMVLKFGPGTDFDDTELDKAGVPSAVYSRDKPYVADPIIKYLPYRTDNYAVQDYPSKTQIGSVNNKKPLDLLVYEFPRTSIYATPERRAQYTAEALQWIRNQGLNPDNYTLIPRGSYDID